MNELNNEMPNSKRIEAALNAEVNRIWREANSVPAATAVRYDEIAEAYQLEISFNEQTTDTEAKASVQRFIELVNEHTTLKVVLATARTRKAKTLEEGMSVGFATPETVQFVRLIPFIREGLESLFTSYTKAIAKCGRLTEQGTVNEELQAISEALAEVLDVLGELKSLVGHFRLFDRTEALFLDDEAKVWIDLAHECLKIERKQGARLLELEGRLERLAA
jgi:hypothetical protein